MKPSDPGLVCREVLFCFITDCMSIQLFSFIFVFLHHRQPALTMFHPRRSPGCTQALSRRQAKENNLASKKVHSPTGQAGDGGSREREHWEPQPWSSVVKRDNLPPPPLFFLWFEFPWSPVRPAGIIMSSLLARQREGSPCLTLALLEFLGRQATCP